MFLFLYGNFFEVDVQCTPLPFHIILPYEVRFLHDLFNNLSSCEWIALASSLSVIISQGLTSDEVSTLANFFSALGDNLDIIASGKDDFR